MSLPTKKDGLKLPVWTEAIGSRVWDDTGKEYIDFTSGIFTANLGHDHCGVAKAIREMPFIHSYHYPTPWRERYVKALRKFTGYEPIGLFSAGTEATEAAIRIMWHYNWQQVWANPGGFHGKTLGAREVVNSGALCRFRPGMNVIMEPYIPWNVHWHDSLPETRGLFCMDEIQAGFGRTGKLFGYEWYDNFKPDLICIGKGMGNGFPISGLLARPDRMDDPVFRDAIELSELSSTHGGGPMACAAGLAVIEAFQADDVVNQAATKSMLMSELLEQTGQRYSARGMVAAVFLNSTHEALRIVQKAQSEGLLLVWYDKAAFKVGPPLTISEDLLREGFEILEGVL